MSYQRDNVIIFTFLLGEPRFVIERVANELEVSLRSADGTALVISVDRLSDLAARGKARCLPGRGLKHESLGPQLRSVTIEELIETDRRWRKLRPAHLTLTRWSELRQLHADRFFLEDAARCGADRQYGGSISTEQDLREKDLEIARDASMSEAVAEGDEP
ncbi:hypothetical protein [Rhizobium laguerreae]|uniref:hypothetical protein n=1 Tax=Rhizobium laguerreae TaxID=1076926 RepID=UPI001C92B284|nr:hypothetical protein [Rhizobium laguerreae]MBY3568954.1 hypothetical protein [Rhizobium laguerreae]